VLELQLRPVRWNRLTDRDGSPDNVFSLLVFFRGEYLSVDMDRFISLPIMVFLLSCAPFS
jgi:hypothetical protein